jgi:hypothetical protein
MQPPARTVPDAGSTCRACGTALPVGKSVCPTCGAAHGEENRCPHCHAIADVEPHAALGFRCLVCGGPRIALDARFGAPSQATKQALLAAGREHTQHLMFTAAGLLLAGMGALGLVVATLAVLAASPGVLATLAALSAAAVPSVAGLLTLRRAAGARKQRAEALHAARLAALGDAQAVAGPLDATRAAGLLRIDPERAELLLAEASVAALLQPTPEPKLRVEGPASTVLDDETDVAPHTEKQRGQTEI